MELFGLCMKRRPERQIYLAHKKDIGKRFTMIDIEKKRKKEERLVEEMIALYCRKNHTLKKGGRQGGYELCPVCQKLRDYAVARSGHCPFMEQKTFCNNCRVHCYSPKMREEIRKVMRFSGPRMLLYHPGLVLWHLICSAREKRKIGSKKEKE